MPFKFSPGHCGPDCGCDEAPIVCSISTLSVDCEMQARDYTLTAKYEDSAGGDVMYDGAFAYQDPPVTIDVSGLGPTSFRWKASYSWPSPFDGDDGTYFFEVYLNCSELFGEIFAVGWEHDGPPTIFDQLAIYSLTCNPLHARYRDHNPGSGTPLPGSWGPNTEYLVDD